MTGEIDNLNLGSFICLEFILSDVEGFPIFFASAFPTAKKGFSLRPGCGILYPFRIWSN